jgi:hypothetical protein
MEVTTKSTVRREWASPRVKTIEAREPVSLLVCSAATQWDCDAIYPGCGCVRKSSDQQHDCENACGL